MNECPLGSGALSGNPFGVDREALAADLGFARPTVDRGAQGEAGKALIAQYLPNWGC